MTQQDWVVQELSTLPSDKIAQVLDFIRFLKIHSKSDEQIRREFRDALVQARARATERGITENDIAVEIRQVRAEQ